VYDKHGWQPGRSDGHDGIAALYKVALPEPVSIAATEMSMSTVSGPKVATFSITGGEESSPEKNHDMPA